MASSRHKAIIAAHVRDGWRTGYFARAVAQAVSEAPHNRRQRCTCVGSGCGLEDVMAELDVHRVPDAYRITPYLSLVEILEVDICNPTRLSKWSELGWRLDSLEWDLVIVRIDADGAVLRDNASDFLIPLLINKVSGAA